MVEITKTNRGFHIYGDPFKDSYGADISVLESSSAEGPHVWVSVKGGGINNNDGSAHLNEDQAKELIARLQTWINEIPSRWAF